MSNLVNSWVSGLTSLLFPNLCITCENHLLADEEYICMTCHSELPFTAYTSFKENPVYELFKGRIEIVNATSLLNFERGNMAQKIMHELKYRNNPGIGEYFGRTMGKLMLESNNFKNIDAVVPIPIHRSKRLQRGYNQSDFIADGISSTLGITLMKDMVKRITKTSTQTKKKRFERWENVSDVFQFQRLKNVGIRHVLIVDDVITTGSTLEACARCIQTSCGAEISIATLARSA